MHSNLLLGALLLVTVVTVASKSSTDQSLTDEKIKFHSSTDLEEEWKAFKIKFHKTYQDENEEKLRQRIFTQHFEAIEAHNHLYSNKLRTFTMGINQFSDLEQSEMVKLMTGYKPRNSSDRSNSSKFFQPTVNATVPDEIDWREKGYVTPVKYQGSCGSCWAFSATGSLEGQHFRRTGVLVSLSEQNLVDCSTKSYGCDGGSVYTAFEYIAENNGIDTEESYPYVGTDGMCKFSSSTVGATCRDFVYVPSSESALKEALAEVGPISALIDAGLQSFQNYREGVYDDPNCSSTKLNHAVLVVGYGKTSSGEEYWLVKNSWGEGWGMDGYVRMARNKNNLCGIARNAAYPLVD